MDAMRQLLDGLLKDVFTGHRSFRDRHLALFCAMRGREYARELMIVGRALNGWQFSWEPEDMEEPAKRQRVVDRTVEYGLKPTSLLNRLCGADDAGVTGYNWRRSAFLRVVAGVAGELGLADARGEAWAEHLVYSNLYKVSKHHQDNEGTLNPSPKLRRAQFERTLAVLRYEIEQWKPKRILFLTGEDWARRFLDRLGAADQGPCGGHVKAHGAVTGAKFVVIPHPQAQPEKQLISEAMAAFNSAKAGGSQSLLLPEANQATPVPSGQPGQGAGSLPPQGAPPQPAANPSPGGTASQGGGSGRGSVRVGCQIASRREFEDARHTWVSTAVDVLRPRVRDLYKQGKVKCVWCHKGTTVAVECALKDTPTAINDNRFTLDIIFLAQQPGGEKKVCVRMRPVGHAVEKKMAFFKAKYFSKMTAALAPLGLNCHEVAGPKLDCNYHLALWAFAEPAGLWQGPGQGVARLCEDIIRAVLGAIPLVAADKCKKHGQSGCP